MANGDIQWSGRAVRWLVWRLPKSAAKYTWDSNMALASDLGRRWMTWLVYGGFLWGLRKLIVPLIPPLRTPVAILILLWFYWGASLALWSWRARPGAARNRQAMREMYQTVHELRTDVREAITTAANRLPTGGVTMRGSMRHHDPTADEHARMARDASTYIRRQDDEVNLLGPQGSMPIGDKFEPLISWPGFLRRQHKRGDR